MHPTCAIPFLLIATSSYHFPPISSPWKYKILNSPGFNFYLSAQTPIWTLCMDIAEDVFSFQSAQPFPDDLVSRTHRSSLWLLSSCPPQLCLKFPCPSFHLEFLELLFPFLLSSVHLLLTLNTFSIP